MAIGLLGSNGGGTVGELGSVSGGSGGGDADNSTKFAVALDASGLIAINVADANTYTVEALTLNGEPANLSELVRYDQSNTTQIKLKLLGFDSADTGLVVAGRYYPAA